jgi:hypothetical protein
MDARDWDYKGGPLPFRTAQSCVMDARDRVYKGGPLPFWATRKCYLFTKENLLPFCLRVELTEVLYVPRIEQRHSFFSGKAYASGPAYFQHLEGALPAGGEFVKPFAVQDSP